MDEDVLGNDPLLENWSSPQCGTDWDFFVPLIHYKS